MKKVLKYLTMLCLTVFVGVMFHSVDVKAARANGTTSIEVNEYTNYPAFSVHTDSDWSVDVSADFVTALNPTGTAGDAQIVLRIDSNPGKTSRSATIIVRDNYGAVSLSVTQRAKEADYFKILESPFKNGVATIGADGGQLKYTCESDKYVSVRLDGKTVVLISKKSNGKGGYIYEYGLPVSANNTYEKIEHKLEINVDGDNITGGKHHSYSIIQDGREKPKEPKQKKHYWWEDIFIVFRFTF